MTIADTSRTTAETGNRPARPPGRAPIPAVLAAGLVFGASGAILVIEIMAVRLLAPYVGITLQASSTIIGTALAAIAVGAWTGGRLADRFDGRRLVGPLLVVSGIVTALSLPAVRLLGEVLRGEPSAVLVLSAVAVVAPATLLAVVTPLVVTLRLHDLARTGRVVGALSGLANLGAILATFLTGFVLVAVLPSTAVLVGLGGVLVLAGLVTGVLLGQRRPVAVAAAVVAAVAAGTVAVLPGTACRTETSYNCANVVTDPANPTGRILRLGAYDHSYVDLRNPTYLAFPYLLPVAGAADALGVAGARVDALHIGGGGMTLPRYLRSIRPDAHQLVHEIDGGLVDLARSELDLVTDANLQVRVGDGRVGLHDQPADSVDLVVQDAYGQVSPPWHLTTREAVQQGRRVLRPAGIYAANLVDSGPLDFSRAAVATMRAEFAHVHLFSHDLGPDHRGEVSIVALASDVPLPIEHIRWFVTGSGHPLAPVAIVADRERTARFAAGSAVLTDEMAPVDQLLTPVAPDVVR